MADTAALYIRVSTEEQTEFSPDAQRYALERYAAQAGLSVDPAYIYIDEGLSGRRAETRPAFQRMIAAARAAPPPFSVILVHRFDRFARSREDSVVYKSLLKKECGVRVVSVTETLEDDKFSIILESMLEAMAEYYSLNLSDEVKKGMTEKARRGGFQGAPPFGYRMERGQLCPDPEQQPFVREIYAQCLAGASCYAIAQQLNASGVRTKTGRLFERRTVEYILRNPLYAGYVRWNPNGPLGRRFDISGVICAKGSHPPLIEPDVWDAVQARFRAQPAVPHRKPAEAARHWASGLVRCAQCGKPLVKSGGYFRCSGYVRGTCPHAQRIQIQVLESMLLAVLRQDMPDNLRGICTISPAACGASEAASDLNRALHAQLRRLDTRIARAREAYVGGADTLEEYNAVKKALLSEQAAVRCALDRAAQAVNAHAAPAEAQPAETLADCLADPSVPHGIRHAAVRAVVYTAIYDKSAAHLRIIYAMPPTV